MECVYCAVRAEFLNVIQVNCSPWKVKFKTGSTYIYVALGGLVVSVLATGPKCAVSIPAEVDGFLRAIKLPSEGK
jgi:hypothetical protein